MIQIKGKARRRSVGVLAAVLIVAGEYMLFMRPTDADKSYRVGQSLDRRVSYKIVDTPVIDALRNLAKRERVPLRIEPEASQLLGNRPITLDLKNVKTGKILQTLVKLTTSGSITARLDDGTIVLTTRQALHRLMSERVYDVNTLGSQLWSAPDVQSAVAKLVTDTVDSDSWQDNGGIATIRVDGNCLIVRQTPENHVRIEQLLEQLLATRADPVVWVAKYLERE